MLFFFVRADRDVRFAAGLEKSGHSQFAPLKLRSLAVAPSSGARCAPANSTYGSSTARLFVSAPEVFPLALHHFLPLPLHRLAAVPRPGARVDTNGKRPTGAKVDRKRYSLSRPADPSSSATLHCHPSRRDSARQSRTETRSALPAIKEKEVTVSSRLLRSLRLLRNRQLTVLVHPPQPPGAIIGRAGTSLRITVTACIREH